MKTQHPKAKTISGLCTAEAARYLGISVSRVKQLLSPEDGRLTGFHFGRSWVVDLDSLRAYKARHNGR